MRGTAVAGYGKVFDTFWTEETGRLLRQAGRDYQLTALFLVTAPCRNMIGLFRVPPSIIAHHLNWTPANALHAIRIVAQTGFCEYDEETEEVWIPEFAKWQIGEALDSKDKRVAGVKKQWDSKRRSRFYLSFYARYKDAYHLPEPSPLEAPSKPLGSQQLQLKQQQKQQQQQSQSPGEPPARYIRPYSPPLAVVDAEVREPNAELVAELVKRGIASQRAKAAVEHTDPALLREILKFFDSENACGVFKTSVGALRSMLESPEGKWSFERTEDGWKPPASSGKKPLRPKLSREEKESRLQQQRELNDAEKRMALPLDEIAKRLQAMKGP